MRNRDSEVSVVIRLQAGRSGVHNRAGECFTFSIKISRPALEPKQPPIHAGTGGSFVEGKVAGA
jgi:hypothetical protein